jgi:AraC-like DNA-binding protein
MLDFYRKAIAIFLVLLVLTATLAYICMQSVSISDALFPAHQSTIPWKLEPLTDARRGGSSSVSVNEDIYSLGYEYRLTEDIEFPSVTVLVAFAELKNASQLADLSEYSTATFRVKCAPRNILTFYLYSFDEQVTDPANIYSYRIATTPFSCRDEWSMIEIDLKHLEVPVWWLEMANIDLSNQDYRLDRALAIGFDSSRQGPVKTPAKVTIAELTLHGQDWRYAWVLAGFSAIVWIGFIGWLFRQYTVSLIESVKDKLKKDRPLTAYQRLSIKPHRDKEKSQLLRFMATEYTNPDMSLEFAAATLGINRTKINELLKDELGMTFNANLNKLRLAGAARLLSQQGEGNVAEVAYLVGYNNVSYFSKLFKTEYGCTPGAFTGLYKSEKTD